MAEKRLPGIKQGATFSVYLDYSIGGVPEAFSATQLTAQVRSDNNLLLGSLTIVAEGVVVGRFIASALPAATQAWPEGDVYFDIKRSNAGVVTPTDTVVMEVSKRVTT